MIRRNQHGFTLVELTIVIAVIAILSVIGMVSYIEVQKQARDNQRQADILTFQNELEKFYEQNGTYPPGCPSSTCTTWFLTENTSSSILTSTTTLATIRSVLPGVPTTFGDPTAPDNTKPLMDKAASIKQYYYFGGTIDSRSSGSSANYGSSSSMPCSITSTLSPGQTGSYVLGYFSESAGKWVLVGGKHGVPMTITGNATDGCVINS